VRAGKAASLRNADRASRIIPTGQPGLRAAGLQAAFESGGAMGRMMAELDWSATPLGPIESWPQSLVSSISILLASKAQIVMFWGPDYLALYNDSYAPTIGDKHPAALGQPASKHWAELWETLEPLLAGVRESGEAFSGTDYPFSIDRRGFLEDVYFDISYDPVRVEDGSVGGVFCIVSETTPRVLSARRMELLTRINAYVANTMDAASVVQGFLFALGPDRFDLPFLRLLLGDHRPDLLPPVLDIGPVPAELQQRDLRGGLVEDLVVDGQVVAVAFPLRAGGGIDFGTIVLGVNERYELDTEYRQFFGFVAERLASALINAQLLQTEHRLAATLQRAILPAQLYDLPGVELAGEYLPATAGLDVGGDWYDALPLPDGRVALVIGDVAGKGVQAAALMGQLRNALRAYLVDGHDPASALTRLNRLTMHLGENQFATVLCAILDPRTGALEVSTAGHLPPLLVAADRTVRYLDCRPGPPVGVTDTVGFALRSLVLEPAATLVLFTDGLVEERTEDLDVSLGRAAAAACGSDTAPAIVRRLSRLRPPSRRSDDIAILGARRLPQPE